ncbi:MAG: cobalamin-dependent protein, partial [Acidobacteria bacterium]|nr:cobalamin-dependent protein [Acidobacteriota bacterium]
MTYPQRLLWVQLGVPDMGTDYARENVPIAAGYVLGWLRRSGLYPDLEPQVLDMPTATFAGDAALLRAIEDQRSDILCLTCYMWNIERSLWLAEQVKYRWPGTRILLGGPEITPDSPWWTNTVVDALVSGEGETGLPLALDALHHDEPRPVRIEAPLFSGLADMPDPYSAGIIPPGFDGTCFVESMRGCPYQCQYCFYSKQFHGLRHHGDEHLHHFFRWAQRRDDVTDIYFIDPSFNVLPTLDDRLPRLAAWNRVGLPLHTETRLEGITPERARAFRRAGFCSVEAGLQSIHRPVCAGVGRTLDLPRFEEGLRALQREEIGVEIGVILGLPDDDLTGFTRTLQWLADRELAAATVVFLLSLLPGTALRTRALAQGWRFMPLPPYTLLGSDTWDQVRLLEGLTRLEERLGCEYYTDIEPFPAPDGIHPFIRLLELDLDDVAWSQHLAAAMPRLALSPTLEIRGRSLTAVRADFAELGRRLRADCPHGLFRVVFRPAEPPVSADWDRLAEAWPPHDSYWTRANYFRESRATATGAHFFLRVPATGWRDFVATAPADLDLVLELPPQRADFEPLRHWLRSTERRGRTYLLPVTELPPEYR